MKIWIVIAKSCDECNSLAVAVYDHEPKEEEKDIVVQECGGY